ncbi:hypothetical protein F8388_004696 [Cannabis sativa]|uniref:Protein FAR1-RELATED SEQUENCE n=1 Tax=Cannabis sativa TaxID=3483 RepID=A0A7J6HPS4_CANSA|nr:hypothetical protein F8388_004696 [Cannabis sativa]
MANEENNLRSSQNEVEVIKIPEHEVENNGDRAHVQEANDEDVEETKDEEGHVNEELAQPDIAQWTILLQFLGIDKEPEDIEFSDFNGKEFLSIEQAESSKARDLRRTGCRAEFRINLNRETGMWVTKCFRTHHNHALGSAIQKPFLRSKRKFTKSTMEQLMLMKRAGIGTSQVWQYLVEVSDGWENVGCMKDDLYEKPLVILLGSNNHDKTCVFGVALLEKENWETNNWYYKVEEWEHNWMELLEKYDLANNKWIKDQYKSRDKWADTYLRGHYFGGARATGENGIKRKNLEIMNFPTCLVKSRWLNDAKDMQSATLGIERRCPHPEVIENSRYSSVTSQTCITSYLASRSQEAFEKAMSVISNLNAELEKIPPDKEFNILNKNEGEFPNNILDSKILKTRGRPTIASSSRSSPQGKDKNKRKSDDRHCAICSGTDHDKRNCPTKPKLTTDSPTQPKLPSKKNDQAKKKMKVNM